MGKLRRWAFVGLCGAATVAVADTIKLRDGTTRQGTVLGQDVDEVRLEIKRDGIRMVLGFRQSDVVDIQFTPVVVAASEPAAVTRPAPVATKPTERGARRVVRRAEPSGNLLAWSSSFAGHGPADVAHLPPVQRELWSRAVHADETHDSGALWEALRGLGLAARLVAGEQDRLDAVCWDERQKMFAAWLAQGHWEVIRGDYARGVFDLGGAGEEEKPYLIGILKSETDTALNPIEAYFPPINPRTGVRMAYGAAQLAAIDASNALQVKEKALYAAAVLQTQLKLEPEMPAVDQRVLAGQLVLVNRVLGRVRSQEGAARAMQAAQRRRGGG